MSDVSSNPSRPTSPSVSLLTTGDLPTARPYRFVWDPSTRRPGPESVAGTTEGGRYAGDYIVGYAQHPLGVLNNPSSMNLELGSLPTEWSSAKLGFHAISTVLNNPHKKQAPPKAHSSLPSVPPADLPRVRRKDFDSYLKAIKPEWERYERNIELGKEGQALVESFRPAPITDTDEADDNQEGLLTIHRPRSMSTVDSITPSSPSPIQARNIPPLDTVPSVFFDADFNLGDAKTFNSVTEQSSLSSLSTPTQSNTRTAIRESEDDDPNDPLSLSHTLPLLEKFDHYADTVEQHLIREISLRSTSFFAALTNLRDLQTSSTACLSRIQNLRQKLSEVDEGTAKKGLELVRVKRKENRVQEVKEGVKMVEGVVDMMGVLKGLVHTGQWGEALTIVEEVEAMWSSQSNEKEAMENGREGQGNGYPKLESMAEAEESEHIIDGGHPTLPRLGKKPVSSGAAIPLSSLVAFSAMPSHLQSITMEVAASLSAELVSVLKEDWISYVKGVSVGLDGARLPQDTQLNPSSLDSPREGMESELGDLGAHRTNENTAETSGKQKVSVLVNQALKDRLKPLLLSLARTKGLKEGVLSWREVILGELKELVSKTLLDIDSQLESRDDEARAGLANHLRILPQEEFMLLMRTIYSALMSGIERVKSQGEIITQVLDGLRPELQERPKTHSSSALPGRGKPLQLPFIKDDLADFLCSSCELANTSAARVISYRSEQHSQLELPEFIDFFNTSWSFVVRCEVLSRRMIIGLRGTVVTQAKSWLQAFHQARISRSAKLVEDEVWSPAEVTTELQTMANAIIDSAVKDSPDLVVAIDRKTKNINGMTAQTNGLNTTHEPATEGSTSSMAPGTKHLRIDDRTYYTVSATSEVLVLLFDYLKVVVNLSMLTTDTMSRVIEFLKAFNSRTCQVVLGAGAMRSAGLKNISAKHLALASQSLSVVSELIPYIRETFRRHLSQKQAVMLIEFDKLKRDYQEHQNEIHSKLIDIMGSRLAIHIQTLRAVDWTLSSPNGTVNDYMLQVVKDTVGLHKILSRYLPLSIFEYVMSEVLAAINHRLSEEYGTIELPDQQAKNRMLDDARYLNKHFSALKNIRAPTAMLETVVAEKILPRPAGSTVPPTPTPTRSNTFSANQRLRGLLSGKSTGTSADKALPHPEPTTGRTLVPPVPPPAETKHPQTPSLGIGINSGGTGFSTAPSALGVDGSIGASTVSLELSPPIEEATSPPGKLSGGFRQMDISASESSPSVPNTHNAEHHPTNGKATPRVASPPPLPLNTGGNES